MSFSHFQKKGNNRLLFGFFMCWKLPSAFFSGVRLQTITPQYAIVSVPFKWFSQNPFRSTYFACQAMAAEMSTGVLALGHIDGRHPSVSMLVTQIEAVFSKKATEKIFFTCNDGDAILQCIEDAVQSGEGRSFTACSTGRTASGELISEFKIAWSFKAKSHAKSS